MHIPITASCFISESYHLNLGLLQFAFYTISDSSIPLVIKHDPSESMNSKSRKSVESIHTVQELKVECHSLYSQPSPAKLESALVEVTGYDSLRRQNFLFSLQSNCNLFKQSKRSVRKIIQDINATCHRASSIQPADHFHTFPSCS